MHYHSSIGRKLGDLNLEECVTESLFHASELLKATPLKTGNYDIIFAHDIFESVFGCFSNIFSGKAAMEKTNPFAERLGTQVMSKKINITDMPNYKDAFFKSLMDAEGRKHRDLSLVEQGKLKSFYHNSATAKFFGIESTGHAARGAKSALMVKGTTRFIHPADISEGQLLGGEYFEVHSLQGLHSGANAISGDFSFAASGFLVREGKKVQSIKGVTISGNFHKMLLDINLIGDTIHTTTEKSFFSPIFRFENMSVAGV
jgi:PmbA protein